MDALPTIKKPKAKKLEGVETPKMDFKATIEKMTSESNVPAAMSVSDVEKDAGVEGAQDLVEKAQKVVGKDKSDKAEAVRIRAMLVKSKAKKLQESEMQAENPKKKK